MSPDASDCKSSRSAAAAASHQPLLSFSQTENVNYTDCEGMVLVAMMEAAKVKMRCWCRDGADEGDGDGDGVGNGDGVGGCISEGDDDNEGTGVGDDVDEGDRDGERDID